MYNKHIIYIVLMYIYIFTKTLIYKYMFIQYTGRDMYYSYSDIKNIQKLRLINRGKQFHSLTPTKQEHKVSYRCSLPSPLQKRSKDYKGLHWSSVSFELLSFLWLWQNPAEEPHMNQFFEDLLRIPPFVVLGSLLQWRWQWASIGHFVFLFAIGPRISSMARL